MKSYQQVLKDVRAGKYDDISTNADDWSVYYDNSIKDCVCKVIESNMETSDKADVIIKLVEGSMKDSVVPQICGTQGQAEPYRVTIGDPTSNYPHSVCSVGENK